MTMYVCRDHNIINKPKSPRTMSWKILKILKRIRLRLLFWSPRPKLPLNPTTPKKSVFWCDRAGKGTPNHIWARSKVLY